MAAHLAKAVDGEVVLVNVVQAGALLAPRRGHGEPLPGQAPGVARRVERAELLLEATAREASTVSGASVSWRVFTGYPPARIVAAASELEADIVVIGHPSRSRWRRWPAITRRVLRDDGFPPILLVPESAIPLPFRSIAIGPPAGAWNEVQMEFAGRLVAATKLPLRRLPERASQEASTGWSRYDAERRTIDAIAAAAGGSVATVSEAHQAAAIRRSLVVAPATTPAARDLLRNGVSTLLVGATSSAADDAEMRRRRWVAA